MFPSLYAINTLQKICFVRSESTIDIRGFKIANFQSPKRWPHISRATCITYFLIFTNVCESSQELCEVPNVTKSNISLG